MADPISRTQFATNIPEELMPYARTLLGKAEALTSQTPYQPYTGEQVAQFSPLQQRSYDYASQLQSAPQLQDATALAGQAGLGALNAQYTYKPSDFASTFTTNAQGNLTSPFMSPYMQGVVDVQKQQAMRDAAIAQQQRQAQAVNAGAFGGGRQGIMNAQANAELQRNLQGIQATGLQNAYQQAMQQYNTQYGQNAAQQQFGAGLGMQGLQLANQAAANLGAIGQTQYGQNVGLIGLQNQLGLQQQQQAQNILNTQYQNYQNQLNYPYKNLGFMSDIIRGTPLAQSSQTMYQAAPTAMQNLSALGLGAYGLSSLFKADGGQVKSYADGGSVMSPGFKRYAVDHIDPRQLPLAQRNAQMRGDLDTSQFAMQEMADDAALRRGLTSALPAGVDVVRAAGGGILAFAKGGDSDSEGGDDSDTPDISSMFATRVADPKLQAQLGARQLGLIDYLTKTRTYRAPSKEDRLKYMADYSAEMRNAMGESPYGDMRSYIQQQLGGLGAEAEEARKLAALEAIPEVLQPGGTIRGIGAAVASLGRSGAKIAQNQKIAKQQLAQMQFNIADAERKERMGLHRDARASFDAAEANAIAANKADVAAKSAAASAIAKTMAANKVSGAGGAGAAGKEYVIGPAEFLAQIKQEHPDWTPEKQKAEARRQFMSLRTPGMPGAELRVESAEQIDFNKRFQAELLKRNPDIRKAQRAGDTARVEQIRAEAAKAAEVPSIKGGATAPAPTGGAKPIYATNGKERIVSTDGGQTWKPVGAP